MLVHGCKIVIIFFVCKQTLKSSQYYCVCVRTCVGVDGKDGPPGDPGQKGDQGNDGKSLTWGYPFSTQDNNE